MSQPVDVKSFVKFIQSLCLYLLDILYSYKSLFHEYLMFNITKKTTICNYGHVKGIFSQLNIYTSYLASLNFEFNDLTKFETSFMLNLENSQVMFFFLLVPVSSFLDFGDREELVTIVTRRRLIPYIFTLQENSNLMLTSDDVSVTMSLSSVTRFCST